jgi:hypothetical protein
MERNRTTDAAPGRCYAAKEVSWVFDTLFDFIGALLSLISGGWLTAG